MDYHTRLGLILLHIGLGLIKWMQIVLTKQIKCHSELSSCQLSKPPNPLVFNGQYQGGWNTNQNQMKNTPPVYIVFQVLKVLLTKNCKISHQIFYFLLLYISVYISRHHFSQMFRTVFNIIGKKDFCHEFSFFNEFNQTPHAPRP